MAQYVEKQTLSVCCNCLGQVFWAYNLGGFQITNARCDKQWVPPVQKLVLSITMKTIVVLLLLSLVCLLRLWLKIELQLLPCSCFNRIRLPSW
jgi:hypothetical protein